MTTKDYTLLRPFDLEKAKAGEAICYFEDAITCNFLAEDRTDKTVAIQWCDGSISIIDSVMKLRMAPLAWVEGKPVYRGDVLYGSASGESYTITGVRDIGKESLGSLIELEDACPLWACQLTWTPPKKARDVKLLGWLTTSGQLQHIAENEKWPVSHGCSRVTSEDRTVTVEE